MILSSTAYRWSACHIGRSIFLYRWAGQLKTHESKSANPAFGAVVSSDEDVEMARNRKRMIKAAIRRIIMPQVRLFIPLTYQDKPRRPLSPGCKKQTPRDYKNYIEKTSRYGRTA